jgi:hypothetical protein
MGDPIRATVESLLEQVYRDAKAVAPARPHEFAANVLLNALQSVLEAVREDAPDQYEAYQRMMVSMLEED